MDPNERTVPQIISDIADIADEVCLHYCKWPEKYSDESKMEKEHREKYPILKLT